MSFQYRIYGLQIESSREIKLLSEQKNEKTDMQVYWTTNAEETPDAKLQWKPVLSKELEQKRNVFLWRAETEEGTYTKLRFNTRIPYIDFLLDASKKRLWIIYAKDKSETDLDSYFVGPVMGCMLRLRGTVCLHASVVNIDEKAVLFLGKKSSGKSTTAAAFHKLGYKVLADDIAVITSNGNSFYVEPGYPKIRLRPNPVAALLDESTTKSLKKVYSHLSSRYLPLEEKESFSAEPLPLGAIYILGTINQGDTTPFVEPIKSQEKIIRLAENTFASYVVNEELRKKEFAYLFQLAKKIPLSRLMYGHDLITLPLQCQAVIEHFHRLTK